jgi:hypothetical protein
MKTTKVKTLLGITVIILFTINWMFLTPDKLQWGGLFNKFPIVKYKVNPTMIGFNTGSNESIIDIIRSAGNLWSFQSGESHFKLSYNGLTTTAPAGYDQMGCTEDAKKAMRELDNIVYASNVEDDDCSGQACTYIWSCEDKNEILHFDMQINASGYEWDMGTNHKKSYNLFTVVANQFGQLLGLSHCATGESEADCQAKVAAQGTSNPTSDSLLYKFIEPEVIRTGMSADDKAGLKALYGELTPEEQSMKAEMQNFAEKANAYCMQPCVTPDKETNAKYMLNGDDVKAIQLYWQELSEEGKNNKDWLLAKYKWIEDSYTTAYSYNGKSAEYYLLDAIEQFHYYQDGGIPDHYKLERILLSVQISIRQRLLDDAKQDLDPIFYKFIENEQKILIQLRRMFIDAL